MLSVALVVPFVVSPSPSVSAATYTGCSSWRTVTNPWTGLAITPGSNQRYANLNSMNLSCADLSGVDFYGAVIGGVDWSNSNLTNTNFGGTSYCGGTFTGADIAGSNLQSTGTWTCASGRAVYVAPTTSTATTTVVTTTSTTPTTTLAPTTTVASTTTTVAPNYYCLKHGGSAMYVTWSNSRDLNWGNVAYRTTPGPGVPLIALSEWLAKSDVEKSALWRELAVRPVPAQGCSSLNETLVLPTTTTTSSTTTVPPEAVPSTPTTTIPLKTCAPVADQLYIYNYVFSGQVTNLGGKYDSGVWGWSYDYSRNCAVAPLTQLLIEDNAGVRTQGSRDFQVSYDLKISNCWRVARVSRYGQSEWSNRVCYTAPVTATASIGSTSISSQAKKTVKVRVPKGARGAQCFDGFRTTVKTSKACSSHFGVDFWIFKSFKPGYSFSYSPKRSISSIGAGSGRCVGVCFGVPSTVNGLPRNTYVNGYYRKDGTKVGPYTRSNP